MPFPSQSRDGELDDESQAARLAQRLQRDGVQVVFLLAYDTVKRQLLLAAAQIGWRPAVFASGSLTGREMLDAPEDFQGRMMLAFSGVGAQLGETDERFRDFVQRNELVDMDPAVVQDAYASASILVTALMEAGSDVTRSTLINALEQVREFSTGVSSPVTFGPNRHIGILAVSVFSIDLRRQQLVLVHEHVVRE